MGKFIPTAHNQPWASDINYIAIMNDEIHRHFCHLSMALDAHSEKIGGGSVGPTLDTSCPMEALRMAMQRTEGKEDCLTHHADRGCQYDSR